MYAILAYLLIFSYYWSASFLFYFPHLISYKQFVTAITATTVILTLCILHKRRYKISIRELAIVTILVIISGMFYLTRFVYGIHNNTYSSYFLSFVGQTVPLIIYATMISTKMEANDRIKKLSPFVSVIFSIIAFLCVINPSSKTGGGLAKNDNGLNYQTIAYMAAYASGLAEFGFLLNNYYGKIYNKVIGIGLILLNFITVLLSGGRGGFVAFLVFIILTFISFGKQKSFIQKVIVQSCIAVVILLILFASVKIASGLNISTSGLWRIAKFISSASDSNRLNAFYSSLNSFYHSMFIGHGIGSVFYEIGFHAHNIFLDLLVETGLFGTAIILIIIFRTFIRLTILIKQDRTNVFWVYVFLCGATISMFSGYYLTQFPLWWVIFYISGIPKVEEREQR